MPTKNRKIEVYRLKISGLPEGMSYGNFVNEVRRSADSVADTIMKQGEKWHGIMDFTIRNRRMRVRFLSYKKGHRPDILNTENYELGPNPLMPTQTGVEYTHVLGNNVNGRYLLIVERNHSGIWPSTIEKYLQRLIDKFYDSESDQEDGDPITVNLEAEAGPEFIERLDRLNQIKVATVRVVRPNPGWSDLDSELGRMASDSDARRAEITMGARRNESLDKSRGLIRWIIEKFHSRDLDYASIQGKRGRQTDSFNTQKLIKHTMVPMEIDERGQVVSEDAWSKMAQILNDLE